MLKQYPVYSGNPFRIDRYKLRSMRQVKVVERRGVNANGTVNVDIDEWFGKADFEKHVRVYEPMWDILLSRLSTSSLRVLLYIFKDLRADSDEVLLNVSTVMVSTQMRATSNVYKGIEGLLRWKVIAKKASVYDIFFINPIFIFQGTRATWFKGVEDVYVEGMMGSAEVLDDSKKTAKMKTIDAHLHEWVEDKTFFKMKQEDKRDDKYILSRYCPSCGKTETFHGGKGIWIETGYINK